MTDEELERGLELHERRVSRIEENLIEQQAELLNRVDQRLDRVTLLIEQSEVKRAENRKRMHLMQSAMTALFKRLEAFIRGLERHKVGLRRLPVQSATADFVTF